MRIRGSDQDRIAGAMGRALRARGFTHAEEHEWQDVFVNGPRRVVLTNIGESCPEAPIEAELYDERTRAISLSYSPGRLEALLGNEGMVVV